MLIALPLSLLLAAAGTALPATNEKRAQLQLVVNGSDQGVKSVLLRGGGEEVLVLSSDLASAGLRGVDARAEQIGDQSYVPLSSIPDSKFQLDTATLALQLTVDARWFAPVSIDFAANTQPANLATTRAGSAFLNYALQLDTARNVGGTAEFGASFGGNLFLTSASSQPGEAPVRGLTSFISDDPASLRRVVAGDQIASTGVLGGALTVAGVGVSREFSLNPYFTRYALPTLTGAASTPSTLEVYVNGVLVKREAIPPGVYSLTNLPVSNGSGIVRTVVRDAFGEQVTQSPYYFTSGLLTKGLSDYSYVVGAVRNDLGASSFSYGDPMFLARHRVGLTDSLTAGMRVEGGFDRLSGGPSATFLVPFGELQLDLAASRYRDYGGTAASLAFTSTTRFYSFSADVRTQSRFYATASQSASDDRARLETNVIGSVPIASRLSLSGTYSASAYRDRGWTDQLAASAQLSIGAGASLVFNLGRTRQEGAPSTTSGLLLFVYSFGRNVSASVAGELEAGTQHGIAQLQKNIPLGEGYGYQVQVDTSQQQTTAEGVFQAQSRYGRYELDYQHGLGGDLSSAIISGGVVAMGGRLFATRPVQDSYALIQVPGVEGVHGFLENQDMGRTDKNGDLFLPNMLPYYGGQIRIATEDLPLGYTFNANTALVAPGYRSGALVPFAIRRVHGARGTVLITQGGRELSAAFGELTLMVDGVEQSSPIGSNGAFFFENLPSGQFAARVDLQPGECSFSIDVPASDETVLRLGELRCELPAPGEGSAP